MAQRSLPHASDASGTLLCGLLPSGRIDVHPGSPDDGPDVSPPVQRRICEAFAAGRGHGVLHLGARELNTDLHSTLAYWRDIGRCFVARVCGALDPTDPAALVVPTPDQEEIATFAEAVPPMWGAELLTPALLTELWCDLGAALSVEAARFARDGVQGYLEAQSSVWHVVGRVCFHLAENTRSPQYPFAFIATYVHRVSRQATPQHKPLGQALKEYAGASNRQQLLALLSPLSRAAERSDFVRELVDTGDVYHPLSWTPREAHRFLCEVAMYEEAGLVVRLPDWWRPTRRPRPKVSVSVGDTAPSTLGMSALLDFRVELTLDGRRLSPGEVEALLASTEGLVLIKGKWVEVDREKLGAVLDQWRDVQQHARAGGVSFGEAMRMLAGAQLGDGDSDADTDVRPEWSEVIAGKWLASQLDRLRSPELQAEIEANAGLRAELRPYQKAGVRWLWTLRGLELGGCLADDMGLGKTVQVLGVLALSRSHKDQGTDLLVVPRLAHRQLAPGDRALRSPARRAHRPSVAGSVSRAQADLERGGGCPRRGDHHLRHRHADRVDEGARVAKRHPGRGAGHQESERQADQSSQSPGRKVALGPDRHAGGESSRRPVVDLRLSESRAAGVGQGVHPVLQVPGIGHARRLHAAAQAGAAVSLATAQDRQACHRRSARQN